MVTSVGDHMSIDMFTQATTGDDAEFDHAGHAKNLIDITTAVGLCLAITADRHNYGYALASTIEQDLYEAAAALVPDAMHAHINIIPARIIAHCNEQKLWTAALSRALCELCGYGRNGIIPGHSVRIFDAGKNFPQEWEASRAAFASLAEEMLLPFVTEGAKKIQQFIKMPSDLSPAWFPAVLDLAEGQEMLDKPFEIWFPTCLSMAYDSAFSYASQPTKKEFIYN